MRKKCSYPHICALAICLQWLIQMEDKHEKKMFISSHLCTCNLCLIVNTNGRQTWEKNDSHCHIVDQQLVVCFNDINGRITWQEIAHHVVHLQFCLYIVEMLELAKNKSYMIGTIFFKWRFAINHCETTWG
jgi:hypothetical protein